MVEKEFIVLCSGGLDSVTAAHLMRKKYFSSSITLLFFNYGQRSLVQERCCAKACAEKLKTGFTEMNLQELGKLSPSFINKNESVKSGEDLKNTSGESKKWYVPFRNTIFLSYAFAYVESLAIKRKIKSFEIITGFKCEGKEPYPDTTVKYVREMNVLARVAAPTLDIRIVAPLIRKDKEDIVILGNKLGADFGKTWSCYVGRKKQCGTCLACRLRKAGFYWANFKDPTKYLR